MKINATNIARLTHTLYSWLIPASLFLAVVTGIHDAPTFALSLVNLAGTLGLFLFLTKAILNRKLSLPPGRIAAVSLGLLALMILASALNRSNPLVALVSPGMIIFSSLGLLLIYSASPAQKLVRQSFYALIAAAASLSLVLLLSFVGKLNLPLSNFRLFGFNLTLGGLLTLNLAALYLVIALVKNIWLKLAVVLILISVFIPARHFPWRLAETTPLSVNYNLVLEQTKNLPALVAGNGLVAYSQYFARFRPLSFNTGNYWQDKYLSAFNLPLSLFQFGGLVGVGLFAYLCYLVYQKHKQDIDIDSNDSRNLQILFLWFGALAIILPFSLLTLLGLLYCLILLVSDLDLTKTVIKLKPWLVIGLIVPTIGVFAIIAFFSLRSLLAEYSYQAARSETEKNLIVLAYDRQRVAVNWYPYEPRYRIAYSLTNVILATKVSVELGANETDRANITSLIQQAIREAQQATIWTPKQPETWQNLGTVYSQLVDIAGGALDWSARSYATAIAADQQNPQLPIDLGMIFMTGGKPNDAIPYFQLAAELKPGWARPYLNLALAFDKLGKLADAKAAITQASRLAANDDPDAALISTIFNAIFAKK